MIIPSTSTLEQGVEAGGSSGIVILTPVNVSADFRY